MIWGEEEVTLQGGEKQIIWVSTTIQRTASTVRQSGSARAKLYARQVPGVCELWAHFISQA